MTVAPVRLHGIVADVTYAFQMVIRREFQPQRIGRTVQFGTVGARTVVAEFLPLDSLLVPSFHFTISSFCSLSTRTELDLGICTSQS